MTTSPGVAALRASALPRAPTVRGLSSAAFGAPIERDDKMVSPLDSSAVGRTERED